jgi:hypothetical protein
MTRKAEQRRTAAEERLADKQQSIEEIESQLADEVARLDAAWQAKGAQIDTLAVPLEKGDVTVDEVAVVWLPVG